MDTTNTMIPWLEMIDRPAFCVKNGLVSAVNSAALRYSLEVGTKISGIINDHLEEYSTFNDGCLYLPITIAGQTYTCNVTRTKEYDIFLIDHDLEEQQLQTLALAAQHLRIPLSNIMTTANKLFSALDKENHTLQQNADQFSRNLFQLLRIVGNMSDAGCYHRQSPTGMQTIDIPAVIREVLEKTAAIAEDAGLKLQYEDYISPVFGIADSEKLERAIHNLLSNAFKFSKAGSTVMAKLTQSGNYLSFSVCNTSSTKDDLIPIWHRYQRKPAIEDSRNGLGLGMTLISSVAIAHGGTVLVDHPSDEQTRVTMRIAVVNDNKTTCRSPVFQIGDYAGGRDKNLLELSELLSADFYQNSI